MDDEPSTELAPLNHRSKYVSPDGRKDHNPPAIGTAKRGTLEKSWVKGKLIRDIALDDWTQQALARRYGVTRQSITEFKQRHLAEIEAAREHLADEYAGEWITEKIQRLRVYQEAAEKMASGSSPRNAEVLVNILKGAAEELGQLPARTQIQVNNTQVSYEIVGIDPETLT